MKLSIFLFLTTLLLACALPLSAQNGRYTAWRSTDDTWIRVGLKKPSRHVSLSSPGRLLLLDGDTVMGSIEPKGSFYVVSGSGSPASPRRLVQIQAGNKATVEATKKRLENKYPNYSFLVEKLRRNIWALRVGPLSTNAEAELVRRKMVAEGFGDAFPVREKPVFPFSWVDGNFDKRPLKARNPGLVRVNPNDPVTYGGIAYRGILRLRRSGDKIRVINELPLETYLLGVVPTELGPKVFPQLEAIKAQAVAARTYALKNLGRFNGRGYDICDTPACQAYEGMKNETELSDIAVAETRGLVIYYGDELIDALYTSTCGGETDDVENVFPGRNDPYLRGKTSYLAKYPAWKLPPRPVKRKHIAEEGEHEAVLALLYGFEQVPDCTGDLQVEDFTTMLGRLEWILGKAPAIEALATVSYREFWRVVAGLPFFVEAASRQVRDEDEAVLLRNYQVPAERAGFAALLLRHDLLVRDRLITLDDERTMPCSRALSWLLHMCEALGPEPEWRRYRLERLDNQSLHISRGDYQTQLSLSKVRHYVTEVGGLLEFVEEPYLEEWDRIYTLSSPFPADIIKVKESGVVASVDRFSAYDSWTEKKDVATLEKRARRYVRGLRGIKDVKILKRSDAGRVTLLEFVTDKGGVQVDGLNIRWSLGIPDNLFDMLPSYQNGRLVHVTFFGRGWGHGIGMSQVGAFGLARMGWDFEKILTYYYTDVAVKPHQP